ncbi:MAG: tetratricopeptide repeat protein [Bdellovibrio sp.]
MFKVLNFKSFLVILFLPFVSLSSAEAVQKQTSDQDEFAIFEENATDANSKIPSQKNVTVQPKETANLKKETAEQKIERLKKEIKNDSKNISLIVQLAEEFFNKQDYEKCTLLLWKQIDKIDRSGLILLAKAHEKRKEPNEMLRALNLLIGKDNKDSEAYSFIGNAYLLLKKNKDAIENYKKAIELNNKFEPAYIGLVNLYEKRDPPNWYELRILYQDMMEAFGPLARFQRKLCEIDTSDNNPESAIRLCKEAIAKDPKVADPYVFLGTNYKSIGEEALALKTFKKAAADFPKSELAQYQYAKLLEEKKNFLDAMTVYKSGTEADSQSARSWLGLANSTFEMKKFEISLIAFKKACKYDKKNAVAFRRATTILRNQKNTEWLGKFEQASESCTFN